MNKINSKMGRLPLYVGLLLLPIMALQFVGCDDNDENTLQVSTLSRPTAMTIAVVPYEATAAEEAFYDQFEGLWEQCLGLDRRPYAFVANSGNNSVARIDLCTGDIENSNIKGNPFVLSNIQVGSFPVDVEVSVDQAQSRVFVANGGENSLSIIQSKEARPLEYKADLSSRPSRLTVTPSTENEIGDVYAALPYLGKLARVRKYDQDGEERWREDLLVDLKGTETPDPVPAGMAVDPEGRYLYIADMSATYFHIVDLAHPEYPAQTRNVYAAQRDCSISPDGRWLYLSKLDVRRLAVYDLLNDRYVDTNEELPSHRNSPPPTEQFDYDIPISTTPRTVVFVKTTKDTEPEDVDGDAEVVDGDIELADSVEDGDLDFEEAELDGELEDDQEAVEDSEDAETTSRKRDWRARIMDESETESAEDSEQESSESTSTDDEEDPEAKLFAYSIGYDGLIDVIDLYNDLHELYDTTPDYGADLSFISGNDFTKDRNDCVADIDYRVYKGRTPNGLWELQYNGVIDGSDQTVSGRFDYSANRLYDDAMDFSTLSDILVRPSDYDPDDPTSLKGDLLVIDTTPMAANDERTGCVKQGTDADGQPILIVVDQVELEIINVTSEYIEFDPGELTLSNCFQSAVEYHVRANDNYLVYMTEQNSEGARLFPTEYQGRAVNVPFKQGDVITGEDQFQQLQFEQTDWQDYVCVATEETAEGDDVDIYTFQKDLTLGGGEQTVSGMRCQNPWDDGTDAPLSFSNDLISFSICQDEDAPFIAEKRASAYNYNFKSTSGVGVIRASSTDVEGAPVGSLLEDAVFLDLYPDFPRLYIVDSSEEIVYVVDPQTDLVIDLIL